MTLRTGERLPLRLDRIPLAGKHILAQAPARRPRPDAAAADHAASNRRKGKGKSSCSKQRVALARERGRKRCVVVWAWNRSVKQTVITHVSAWSGGFDLRSKRNLLLGGCNPESRRSLRRTQAGCESFIFPPASHRPATRASAWTVFSISLCLRSSLLLQQQPSFRISSLRLSSCPARSRSL